MSSRAAITDAGNARAEETGGLMDLVATPKNPIPLGASVGYIDVRKGIRLRYASWQSSLEDRRGTVCIFPGRTEYIEKYFEAVGELRRRGFAVAVLDWRGQGGSSRLARNPLKGHVNDFAEYEEDLAHFMKGVVLPDCPTPYFALAHSMASTVLFKASTKRGCWFSRMVMIAPMVKILGLPDVAETLRAFGRRSHSGRIRQARGSRPQARNIGRARHSRAIRSPPTASASCAICRCSKRSPASPWDRLRSAGSTRRLPRCKSSTTSVSRRASACRC